MPKDPSPMHVPVPVGRLPRGGTKVHFEAQESERQHLAEQLAIPAVEALAAEVFVAPWRADGVSVSGRLRASVVQTCVVSLDPVRQEIDEPVEMVFVPETSRLARIVRPDERELHVDPEGEDIPETFSGDRIDLGPLFAETVALALDPYPRAPGREYEEVDTDPDPDAAKISPFAALKGLSAGRGEK